MGKLNLKTYSPKNDSSTGTDQFRKGAIADDVILIVRSHPNGTTDCQCGCRQQPANNKSLFKMGHDARLRGKLIRAHCTDTRITTFADDNGALVIGSHVPAITVAENLGWADYLKAALERESMAVDEKAERASAALLARATGPQVGDRKLIRVGRWEYTGQVCAVFEVEGGTEIEYQYVTKKGETKVHKELKKDEGGES